ncbi:MAG: DNA repair protein RadC [Kiritimatiellia bacterium]
MNRKKTDPTENQGNCSGETERSGVDYAIESRSWRIRDIPERLRPREEMERVGPKNVSDDVLLAILLRSGVKGRNVRELASELLRRYGSLTAIASCSIDELSRIRGISKVKAQVVAAGLEVGRRLSEEAMPPRVPVRTPEDAAKLLRAEARGLQHEVFWVLLLDNKNYLHRKPLDITRGLLDASLVHPREVFREAVQGPTAAVVLVHNHPSGDPRPSQEDLRITRQLVQAGKIVDIKVLDHVILGDGSSGGRKAFFSMREEGAADFG